MMERTITDLKEKPHWSYSAFNTYLQCPMKYYFRYIEHAEVERTGVCLPFGRAFHAVLSERAMKGAEFTLEDAKDDFDVYFRGETEAAENLQYKADESYESCLQKGYEMLDLALNNWQDDFVVKSVAEAFTVEVPGLQKPLIGEFDMVITDGGDEAVCDWKTASSKWQIGKPDRDSQATSFCYAYKKLHGKNPIFRFDVYTKAKTPTVNSYYTVRTEDELNRFEWTVNRIERAVTEGLFYPNESCLNCAECPYRERCKTEHSKWR